MPASVSFNSIAAGLTVPERVLLFCLASNTDWRHAGVTHADAYHRAAMMIRGLIEREGHDISAALGPDRLAHGRRDSRRRCAPTRGAGHNLMRIAH
jgi:hypothetical protein